MSLFFYRIAVIARTRVPYLRKCCERKLNLMRIKAPALGRIDDIMGWLTSLHFE
jgi:hypothetical protein